MSSCVRSKISGIFDPDAGQGVDVEEAAVVDVARRDAPMGEAIGLRLQDAVQRAEALGHVRARR